MKITISKKSLTSILKQLDKVIDKRPGLPILGNILIECIGTEAFCSASNPDGTRIKLTTDAKVIDEGAVTVPAKKLKSIISTFKGVDITLSSDDRNLVTISGGTVQTILYGMPAANYPEALLVGKDNKFEFNSTKLKEGLLLCEHSVSDDDSRRALCGLLIKVQKNILEIAGTDGKRLSRYKSIMGSEDNPERDFILEKAQTHIFQNMLTPGVVTVFCDYIHNTYMLTNNNLEFRGKLIAGNFPEYEKVIPTEFSTWIKIPRSEFLEKLETIKLVLSKTDPVIYFLLEDNILTLVGSSADFGNSVDAIEVESGEKGSLQFAFNPEFLLDLFKNTGGDIIRVRFKDCMSAFMFISDDTYSFIEVIMPVRYNSRIKDKGKPFFETAKEYKEKFKRDFKKPVVKLDPKPVTSKPVITPDPKPVASKPVITPDPKPVTSKPVITPDPKPVASKPICGYNPEVLYRIKKNMIKAQLRKRLLSVA